jgi:hypothetical protein
MMPDNKRLQLTSCFVVTIPLTLKIIFHIVSQSKKLMPYQSRGLEYPGFSRGRNAGNTREVALL